MDYRVIAIKDNSGVAVGIEGLNGNAVIFIGSYYLPNGNKPLSLTDGYRFAVNKLHNLAPQGKPLVIGVPVKVKLKRSAKMLASKMYGRQVTFVSIEPAERSGEQDLAKDALKRKTNVEEVL